MRRETITEGTREQPRSPTRTTCTRGGPSWPRGCLGRYRQLAVAAGGAPLLLASRPGLRMPSGTPPSPASTWPQSMTVVHPEGLPELFLDPTGRSNALPSSSTGFLSQQRKSASRRDGAALRRRARPDHRGLLPTGAVLVHGLQRRPSPGATRRLNDLAVHQTERDSEANGLGRHDVVVQRGITGTYLATAHLRGGDIRSAVTLLHDCIDTAAATGGRVATQRIAGAWAPPAPSSDRRVVPKLLGDATSCVTAHRAPDRYPHWIRPRFPSAPGSSPF